MRTPSYLVKHQNGIYYFRYVIPNAHAHLFPKNRREIRRSLKTRVRSQALKLAKVYWVKMTQHKTPSLEEQISDWEIKMRRGSEILAELESFESSYEQTYNSDNQEEYMAHLSDYDFKCLELVTKHKHAKQEEANVQQHPTNLETSTEFPSKPLVELFNKHLKEKGNIETKTLDGYKRQLNLFIRITGITSTNEITTKCIRHYRETLPELPPRIGQDKKLITQTIKQLLAMSQSNKLNVKTVNENFRTIKSFLSWLVIQEYVAKDFSALVSNLKRVNQVRDNEKRAPFTKSDLNKLFTTPEYQQDGFRKFSYRYWVPLLALYTGARPNEICQLLVSDIYEIEGILVIDINKRNNNVNQKKLKSLNAPRLIAVHKKLIALGFKDYVSTVKQNNKTKLFPTLKPDKNNTCTKNISKFFNNEYKSHGGYIEYCDIDKQSKSGVKVLYSFRHTFINQWKQQRLDFGIRKQVAGHSPDNDITESVYSNDYPLADVQQELNKIDFGIDTLPMKWLPRLYR